MVRRRGCSEAEGCAQERHPDAPRAAGYATEAGEASGEFDGGARSGCEEARVDK